MYSRMRKKGLTKKALVMVAIIAMLATLLWPAQNAYAAKAYLDADTSYMMENLAQGLDSTENTGKVWTDKSVGEDGTTTFSVGANAQEVVGKTSKPTDTVILLDVSQGMLSTEKDQKTGQIVYKIQSALEAANNTIDSLMSANENNRVAVVAYSGKRLYTDNEAYNPNDNQVVELLPLAHYSKNGNAGYLTLDYLNVKEKGVSSDPVKEPEGIVSSHGWKKGDTGETSVEAYLGGMSNLQYGLSKGMDVLVNATDTQVNGNTRKPNVILFMGTLPQESCADAEWWNPTISEQNIQYCNRETNDAAHTVKAIMVGAYQKKQIEKHYGAKANLLVSQIFYTKNVGEALAFTSEDWITVSMSGKPLQEIVNAYESKNSYDIPAGLQNNKPGATYALNQHPEDDITADEIFNYVDASFYFKTLEFEQSKVLKGTTDIIEDFITDTEVPLEKDSFVTYTDPIGEYMNIVPYDSNQEGTGIHFNFSSDNGSAVDIKFTEETKLPDGTIEYKAPVANENIDNLHHTIYGTNYAEELQKASIRLVNENGKRKLVAKIPATLIPMGMSTVRYDKNGNLESMSGSNKENIKPFKLIYQVKVDGSIYNRRQEKLIDGKVEAEYINQNANADGSQVYFYSTYKGENTQVEFTPSLTNHYYYFQEFTPAYKDRECTTRVGAIDPNADYYYKEDYFSGARLHTKVKTVKGSDIIENDEGGIRKGVIKHLNINVQTVKKDNVLPSDMVVNDYISQYSLKSDGRTVQNTMGNVVVYGLYKPDNIPAETSKKLVLNYKVSEKDKELFNYVKADINTSFNIQVDSAAEGSVTGKIVDKAGKETVLDNLSITGNYIKDEVGNPISLNLGDKLYLNGENLNSGTKVTVTAADSLPAFLDKASMTKEAAMAAGTNNIVVNPKLKPAESPTEISFKVDFKGEGKQAVPFNFTWNGENNAVVEGSIPQASIDSGNVGAATAKVKAPLGTSAIYIRQSNLQQGITYDDAVLKVNLKTEINAQGNYVTVATGYETGRDVNGEINYTPIEDISATPAFTNTVSSEAGTKVMISGKLSLKKASTNVSTNDYIGKSANIKYDQVMYPGEYKNPIKFTIEPVGAAAVAFEIPTVTVDSSGVFSMVSPALTEGTYQYKITPVAAQGIEYDSSSASKTIEITVDGNGKVTGNVNPVFNGTYKPTGEIKLNYINNLTGRKFFGTERINVDATTLQYNGTTVNDTIGALALTSTAGQSSVVQTRTMPVYLPGEYVFSTTMEEGKKSHTNDSTMLSDATCYGLGGKKLKVKVIDNMDGTLTTEQPDNNFELNWEYRPAQQTVMTKGIVVTADGFHLKAGEFQYQVTPIDGAPLGVYSSPISNPEMELDTKQATINSLKFQFTGKEITDKFNAQDISSYKDHKANFSYEVKELDNGSKFGHDQSVYRVDITLGMSNRAQIKPAQGSDPGTIVTTITKIKDAAGNVVSEPVTEHMQFNHKMPDNPAKVGLTENLTLEASLSGRKAKPLEEKEITLKAVDIKPTDPSIDITKPNDNVIIYKGDQVITAENFAKEFSVQNDASGKFVITDYKVEFKKPGTYKLNLEPVNLGKGFNYMGTKSAIKYVVAEENGQLKVHVSNEFGMSKLTYNFEYHPYEDIDIYVQEELTGRKWYAEDEITSTFKNDSTADMSSASIKMDTKNHEVKVATITLGASSSSTYTITNKIVNGGGLVKTPGDKKEESKVLRITSNDSNDDGVLDITAELDGKPVTISPREDQSGNRKIEILFKTQYKTMPAVKTGMIKVTEDFTGRPNNTWLDTDAFQFKVEAADKATQDAINEGKVELTNNTVTIDKNTPDYKIGVGDFTFNKPGEYKFKLTQLNPKLDSVNHDKTERLIDVNVADNKKGPYDVTLSHDSFKFTNKYVRENVSGNISLPEGTVIVTGEKGAQSQLKKDQFTFEMTHSEDYSANIELPKDMTAKNAANGSLAFENITFKNEGTYKFTIEPKFAEPLPSYWEQEHMEAPKTVTFTVKDNNNGQLKITDTVVSNQVFNYKYVPSDARIDNVTAKIALEGREWLKGDAFTVKLALKSVEGAERENARIEGNTDLVLTSGTENTFGPITFNHTGVYTFEVSEVKPDEPSPGITYDQSKKEFKISVTDDGAGKLVADLTNGSLSNTFTNSYATEDAIVGGADNLTVQKYFTGRDKNGWLDTDVFDFTLEAGDDATKTAISNKDIILGESNIQITNKSAEYKAAFGDITIKKEGNYKFVIKETKGKIPGITYDESVKTVNVKVTDSKAGKLIAKVTTNPLVFSSEYSITSTAVGQVSFKAGTVKVEGSKGTNPELAKDQFSFVMKPSKTYTEDKIVLPGNMNAKNAADGSLTFENITFKKPGTYSFEVTQDVSGKKDGLTYDSSKKTVTFTVSDNNIGGLNITVEGLENQSFNNKYEPIDASLRGPEVTVELKGREWKTEDVFTFAISPKEDYGSKVTNGSQTLEVKSGKAVSFNELTFKSAGKYEFIIKQINPGTPIGGITYAEPKTIVVDITDDGNGKLVANLKTGELNNIFTNEYAAAPVTVKGSESLTVTKNLTGRPGNKWIEGKDEYTFNIKADVTDSFTKDSLDYIEIDRRNEAVITADNAEHKGAFGAITLKKPGTFKFIAEEKVRNVPGVAYDRSKKSVIIEVKDNLDGNLVATVKGDPLVFNNVYSVEPTEENISGSVAIKGEKGTNPELAKDQFSFVMKPSETYTKDEIVLPGNMNAKNAADGSLTFEKITFKKPGTYNFEVTQDVSGKKDGWTYDSSKKTVTFTVTDNNEGGLNVEVSDLKFVNTYSPSDVALTAKVTKELTGRNWETNDEFRFTIAPKEEYGNKVKLPANTTIAIKGTDRVKEAAFNDITFCNTGTFVYEIIEENSGKKIEGIHYDSAKYNVEVKVADDSKGHLTTETTISKDGKAGSVIASGKPVVAAFANDYSSEGTIGGADGNAKIEAQNILIGRRQIEGEFKFQITDSKDNVVATASNPAAADGTPASLEFTPITYTSKKAEEDVKAGIANKDAEGNYLYKYSVRMLTGEGNISAGITPDTSEYPITVNVKDIGKGAYGFTVTYPEGQNNLKFENSYGANDVTGSMSGSMKLVAPEGSKVTTETLAGKYSYKLEAISSGAPMPAKTEASNDAAGNADFGNATYSMKQFKDIDSDETGKRSVQYRYKVTQTGNVTAVTGKNSAIEFTVILKDDGKGNLTTELVHETEGQSSIGDKKFEFVNEYKLETLNSSMTDSGSYVVKMTLSGEKLLPGKFTFELKDKDSKVVATGVNDADGNVKMSPVAFTHPGKYVFQLADADSGKTTGDNIRHDSKSAEVVAEVTDNEDGTMSIKWNKVTITFENAYVPPLPPAPEKDDVKADVEIKNENGSIKAEVSDKVIEDLVKEAEKKGKTDITINAEAGNTEVKGNITVELPKKTLEEVAAKADVNITIKTPSGNVVLDKKVMTEVTKKAEGTDLRLVIEERDKAENSGADFGKHAAVADVKLVSGGKEIHDFAGGRIKVVLPVPEKLEKAAIAVLHIGKHGLEKMDTKAVMIDGKLYVEFDTTHFSEFVVTDEATADKLIADYSNRIKNGVKNTKIKLTSKLVKGGIRLTWKKAPGYRMDGYDVHRSVKKYSGFGKNPYFKAKGTTYKNTKQLKKGVRYYYKVRGYRYIDGEKVYTPWSAKAYRLYK